MNDIKEILEKVKRVSRKLNSFTDEERSQVLITLSRLVDDNHSMLLEANGKDLAKMDKSNPLYDRLQLTDARLDAIFHDLKEVAGLPSPLGEVIEERVLPNGIELKRVRVPFGVVGVVYEARPNVTFDVFALCLKSGNAAVLKGGKDADESNKAIIGLIHKALESCGFPADACVLLPSTHEATETMLKSVGLIDVCIPRGGRKLIDFVRDTAKVPVIETGAGVVHVYFDKDADVEKAKKIIDNAKTRRVSVCNALDSLLVHKDRILDLPAILIPLAEKGVEIYADDEIFSYLDGKYPSKLLKKASPLDAEREWMDMKMGVYAVENLEQALEHIALYGSGHSESIVTENEDAARSFQLNVDAACVYINLPTSFTDGGQFGLGAEIGISTQKLGPRGPMGLREITTYKYILSGNAQIRP